MYLHHVVSRYASDSDSILLQVTHQSVMEIIDQVSCITFTVKPAFGNDDSCYAYEWDSVCVKMHSCLYAHIPVDTFGETVQSYLTCYVP